MEQGQVVLQCDRRDQAIDRPSDGLPFFQAAPVDICRLDTGSCAGRVIDRIVEKIFPCFAIGLVVPDALQYLGEDDAGDAEVFVGGDEVVQRAALGCVPAAEEIYPDARVDKDHTLPARIRRRSPSHRTLPSSFSMRLFLAFLISSSRA